MNDERFGNNVASVEESGTISIPMSEYVNYKDDPVDEFGASTWSGDNFMIFLRMRKKSLL